MIHTQWPLLIHNNSRWALKTCWDWSWFVYITHLWTHVNVDLANPSVKDDTNGVNGKNPPLLTDETMQCLRINQLKFKTSKKSPIILKGMHEIYSKLRKENRKIATCMLKLVRIGNTTRVLADCAQKSPRTLGHTCLKAPITFKARVPYDGQW
jgi:hypothetical protein